MRDPLLHARPIIVNEIAEMEANGVEPTQDIRELAAALPDPDHPEMRCVPLPGRIAIFLLGLLLGMAALGFVTADNSCAATTVYAADGQPDHPYQRWANTGEHVRGPDAVVQVAEHAGPCPPGAFACWYADHMTIYFNPTGPMARWWFRHELGHVWETVYMDDTERARYTTLIGRATWDRERFADNYATCASPWASPRPGLCRMIRRTR
jgi:hypothetical protein